MRRRIFMMVTSSRKQPLTLEQQLMLMTDEQLAQFAIDNMVTIPPLTPRETVIELILAALT